MELPKVCDICGSNITEGDYGESWWLCSNKECKKNNPNWHFNQDFEPYKAKFNKLDNKINKLSKLKVVDYDIEIELHEARWIGEGSGDIKVKNNDLEFSIRFYFDKDEVIYSTDNAMLLNTLSKIDFDLRLKEIWQLMRERNAIFNIKKS